MSVPSTICYGTGIFLHAYPARPTSSGQHWLEKPVSLLPRSCEVSDPSGDRCCAQAPPRCLSTSALPCRLWWLPLRPRPAPCSASPAQGLSPCSCLQPSSSPPPALIQPPPKVSVDWGLPNSDRGINQILGAMSSFEVQREKKVAKLWQETDHSISILTGLCDAIYGKEVFIARVL